MMGSSVTRCTNEECERLYNTSVNDECPYCKVRRMRENGELPTA